MKSAVSNNKCGKRGQARVFGCHSGNPCLAPFNPGLVGKMKSWSPSAWLLVLVSVLAIVPVFAGRIPGKLVVSDLDNCYEGKQPVKFTIASHFESAVQVNVVVEAKFTEGWREVESSLTAPSKTKLVALKPLKVGETLAVSLLLGRPSLRASMHRTLSVSAWISWQTRNGCRQYGLRNSSAPTVGDNARQSKGSGKRGQARVFG
jgi:hypothetical protein